MKLTKETIYRERIIAEGTKKYENEGMEFAEAHKQAEKDLNNDEALFLAGKASSHCRLQYNDTDEQVINKTCYCINKGRE